MPTVIGIFKAISEDEKVKIKEEVCKEFLKRFDPEILDPKYFEATIIIAYKK
jgi:hypothetical protein